MKDYTYTVANDEKVPYESSYTPNVDYIWYFLAPNGLETRHVDGVKLIYD